MCFEAFAVAAAARALGNCFDNRVGGAGRDGCRGRDNGVGGAGRDGCRGRDNGVGGAGRDGCRGRDNGVGGVGRDGCRGRDSGLEDELFRRGIEPEMTVYRGDCGRERYDFCCRCCD